jgi:hypothetical protein
MRTDEMLFHTATTDRGDLLAAMLRPFAARPEVFVVDDARATTVTVHKTAALDVVVTIVPDARAWTVRRLDARTGDVLAEQRVALGTADRSSPAARDAMLRDLRTLLHAITK